MAINRTRSVWIFFYFLLLSGNLGAAPAGAEKPSEQLSEKQLFEQSDAIPRLLAQRKITAEQIPDPHWREDSCLACHRETPKGGDSKLRGKNIDGLCNNCHDTISLNTYIHAVGMAPSEEKRNRMPAPFLQAIQRGGGVVTCITCHDLPMQCKKDRFKEKEANPLFIRGGPYFKGRTELCFNCHNPEHYARLNPHDQISDEGELNAQSCQVCHSVKPKQREVKSINDVSFNVSEDLKSLCTGCHPWSPHPGGEWAMKDRRGPGHLVKPPEDILQQLKKTESGLNIILPLDPSNGRVFCSTCHNPHERGVQRDARSDRGADGPFRLRRGSEIAMCDSCHNK